MEEDLRTSDSGDMAKPDFLRSNNDGLSVGGGINVDLFRSKSFGDESTDEIDPVGLGGLPPISADNGELWRGVFMDDLRVPSKGDCGLA